MYSFLQAIRPADITLLLLFCSALAAAGVYFVNWLRVRHEGACLCIDRAAVDGTATTLRLTNAGSRPGFDVRVALSDRPSAVGLECVRRDETVALSFEDVRFPMEVTIAWTELLAGRIVRRRTMQLTGGIVQYGPTLDGSVQEGAWPLAIAP